MYARLALTASLMCRIWAIYKGGVYDLTDYFYTVSLYGDASGEGVPKYDFLDQSITSLFKQQPGQDLTKDIQKALDSLSEEDAERQLTCMKRVFYLGETDFRKEARCTVQNYLLLAFSIVMMSTVVAKCKFRANSHSRVYTDIRTTLL
jgi:chitin synthase